jgi:dCMP deaminase
MITRKVERPSWEDYFLEMARLISTRSVCFRSKLGAVIVRNGKFVVSTGYNGAPSHQKNCSEIGSCYRQEHNIKSGTSLELCRACGSHAESNAVAIAARLGHSTEGTTMYVHGKSFICTQCKAIIANAGVSKVILRDDIGTVHRFEPEKDWVDHDIDVKKNPPKGEKTKRDYVIDMIDKIGSISIQGNGNDDDEPSFDPEDVEIVEIDLPSTIYVDLGYETITFHLESIRIADKDALYLLLQRISPGRIHVIGHEEVDDQD